MYGHVSQLLKILKNMTLSLKLLYSTHNVYRCKTMFFQSRFSLFFIYSLTIIGSFTIGYSTCFFSNLDMGSLTAGSLTGFIQVAYTFFIDDLLLRRKKFKVKHNIVDAKKGWISRRIILVIFVFTFYVVGRYTCS